MFVEFAAKTDAYRSELAKSERAAHATAAAIRKTASFEVPAPAAVEVQGAAGAGQADSMGNSLAALVPIAAQVQAAINSAFAQFGEMGATLINQFNHVSATLIQQVRRIDEAIRFPQGQKSLTNLRRDVDKFFASSTGNAKVFGNALSGAIGGLKTFRAVRNFLPNLGGLFGRPTPPIKFDSSGLATGTGGVAGFTKALKAVPPAAAQAGASVGRMGSVIAGFTGGIAAQLNGALLHALRGVVTAPVALEKAFAGLAKATDLDPAGLKAMKAELFGLSTSVKGVALGDLISIATTGGKMGIASADLGRFAEGVAKISTAIDDMPAGEIADQIGKLNTVFKLGVEGTMQFGSAIDKLADSGVSSASGILAVSQRISGTAVAAGVTAQETTALAAALLDTGTHSELAASALLRLIQGLNDVEQQEGFADAIGVSAEKFAKQVETKPIVAIQAFLRALKGMNAAAQHKTLDAVGFKGATGAGEIQKLSQQSETLARYVGLANSEFRTLEQINKSYAATAGLVSAKWETFKNQIQILLDKVGGGLLPAFGAILDAGSSAANGLVAAFESIRAGVDSFAGLVVSIPATIDHAFGPGTASMLGQFALGVGAVSLAMGALSVSAGIAGAVFATITSPIALVAVGITAAVAAVGHFTGAFSSLQEVFELAGIAIRNFPKIVDLAVLMATEKFINLGEWIGVLPQNLAIVGDYVANNWSKLIVDAVKAVAKVFENLSTNIGEFAYAVYGFLKTGEYKFEWKGLLDGFEATAAKIPKLIDPHLTSLQEEIDAKLAEIAAAEDKFRAKATAPAAAGRKAADQAAGKGGDGGGDSGKEKTFQLAEFAKSLRAGGRDNIPKQSLDELKKITKANQAMAATLARGVPATYA